MIKGAVVAGTPVGLHPEGLSVTAFPLTACSSSDCPHDDERARSLREPGGSTRAGDNHDNTPKGGDGAAAAHGLAHAMGDPGGAIEEEAAVRPERSAPSTLTALPDGANVGVHPRYVGGAWSRQRGSWE